MRAYLRFQRYALISFDMVISEDDLETRLDGVHMSVCRVYGAVAYGGVAVAQARYHVNVDIIVEGA